MAKYDFVIPCELDDLNNYIKAERGNRFAAANIKKKNTEVCLYNTVGRKIDKKVDITFTWYCKNKMKDHDNICFAKKFILDGMVEAGVLKGDGWKHVGDFADKFRIDKDNPRVEIELKEVS